jgi:N4-(beta-N-acetylglucosaminyl)-L-asparaginase
MKSVVISTWKHGLEANESAYEILKNGGNSLDAVEAGVKNAEDNPCVLSVGYGGLPDADGRVTLDAAIMDWKARIGSVICLENIKNPVSVARLILENTEHTILAGDGAYDFALKNGFKAESLLTEISIKKFHEWKASDSTKAEEKHTDDFILEKFEYDNINEDGFHDTIGMVAIDSEGNLSAACTTSGMAWKLHGRVGDSPIIGAGLYVDGDVGAATSTGRGEECIRACGSFLVVELMSNGYTPYEACKKACERVYKLNLLSTKNRDHIYQVGFIAMNKKGECGAYSVRGGFHYALYKNAENRLFDSDYLLNEKFVFENL